MLWEPYDVLDKHYDASEVSKLSSLLYEDRKLTSLKQHNDVPSRHYDALDKQYDAFNVSYDDRNLYG